MAKPVAKKSSVTVDMLAAIVEDAHHSGALVDLRLATACLLAFVGFLCFNELVALRPCDMLIQKGRMSLHRAKLTSYGRATR